MTKVQDLIDRIVELPRLAGAHQPAVQVANLLLRWCVQSKCVHLIRTLSPVATASFCEDVDARVMKAFCDINECGATFDDVQRRLYETPMAWGGLGMRPLYAVRNAASIGCWMHCLAHIRRFHGAAIRGFDVGWDPGGATTFSFHGEYRCALDALHAELGLERDAFDVLGISVRDALLSEQPKCQKALSRAVLARRFEAWRDTLDPKSRALGILYGASSDGRRSLASAWLVTTPFGPRTTIPDQAFRLAIRKRLGMPLGNRQDLCRVQKGGRPPGGDPRRPEQRRPCGKALLPHADHAQGCARQEIQDRHDGLEEMCAAINREAGHIAHTETEVPGVLSSTKKEPIRADVLVREAAPGTWRCTEVKVRHTFKGTGELAFQDAAQTDEMLRATEAEAHAHYRPAQVCPWVVTSFGRPGVEMCSDIRRLARLRLRQPDVARAVSVQSVQQLLLQRWRAELSCTLVLGDAQVYLAALEGKRHGATGVPPAEVHLYELQSTGLNT